MTCFALAKASEPEGTSSVITPPLPKNAWSPILIGATKDELVPTKTFFPIMVLYFL